MKKLAIILAAVLAASCGSHELTIIHVNDTHSHVDPIRGGVEDGFGGVIERAAYLDSVRTADGRNNVLLLHCGDFSQGSSYFSLLNGDIEIQLINDMGYDATALGNHEFDNGPDELARRLANLTKTQVLCANYDFSGLGELSKYVKPYTIIKRAGKKIGIIGLLVDVSAVVDRDIADRMTYYDPIPIVNDYAAELKAKGCDIVIVLSHLGTGWLRPEGVEPRPDEPISDVALAEQTRNVDFIIGGHSHTFLKEPIVTKNLDGVDTPVLSDGCWGTYVGNLKVR